MWLHFFWATLLSKTLWSVNSCLSTSPQDLPVHGPEMIPKVACSDPRRSSVPLLAAVRFTVTQRMASPKTHSVWHCTRRGPTQLACWLPMLDVARESWRTVWWVGIITGRHLPSFPSVSLKEVEKYDSGLTTRQWCHGIVPSLSDPGQLFFCFGKSSLPSITNTTHRDLPPLALIFNLLHCEVAF